MGSSGAEAWGLVGDSPPRRQVHGFVVSLSPNIRPYMGRPPIYGKTSHKWPKLVAQSARSLTLFIYLRQVGGAICEVNDMVDVTVATSGKLPTCRNSNYITTPINKHGTPSVFYRYTHKTSYIITYTTHQPGKRTLFCQCRTWQGCQENWRVC